ncbi:MAG: substrate-binding domain-containing protein [Chloroflexota bacterium]|nr:substrate-binding domain-containing protein [Chloroflexota bacterium]
MLAQPRRYPSTPPRAPRRRTPFRPRGVLALLATALLTLALLAPAIARSQPAVPELILATTTSTQDSGLLDVLVPQFEAQTGYRVKTIAVGTGQALRLGERGEADVLLVHAPEEERAWMAAGHGEDRRIVMHNDFIIIGPNEDPAGLREATTAADAMAKLALVGAPFVSRGDNSGTNILEKKLWQQAGVDPVGQPWYVEVGQGMGQTLTVANDKQAYTLTDRGTYLARRGNLDLAIVAERFPSLLNVYSVMVVNPDKGPYINVEGARAFADYVVSPEAQATIGSYGIDRFGQPLFVPDAGRTEEELGIS